MSKWNKFYQNRIGDSYLIYAAKRYSPFIDVLQKAVREKQATRVGEFGCGIGTITKLMEKSSLTFTLIDNDEEILALTEYQFHTKVDRQKHDILIPIEKKFDIIHSHGVLEHFTPNEVKQIIDNQLKISPCLIHYVPSDKYDYRSFGDERLLSKEEWNGLIHPTEIIEFNNGYDLILIWKNGL